MDSAIRLVQLERLHITNPLHPGSSGMPCPRLQAIQYKNEIVAGFLHVSSVGHHQLTYGVPSLRKVLGEDTPTVLARQGCPHYFIIGFTPSPHILVQKDPLYTIGLEVVSDVACIRQLVYTSV